MSGIKTLLGPILATPAVGESQVTAAIRASLLSSLFDHQRSLFMSAVASAFVALVALANLRQPWPVLWLIAGMSVVAGRLLIAHSYLAAGRVGVIHPLLPARRYALLALASSAVLGTGSMACVMSGDAALSALAVMVTAGTLGGIASRNAGIPRLAVAQIALGAAPIGLGAVLAPNHAYWVLVPPLFTYIAAMAAIVWRHYSGLVALMTAEQKNAELAARFDAALTHMPHGLCTTDEHGKVVTANRRTAELFGATVEMLRLNVPLPEFIGHVGLEKFGETFRKQLVERCTTWLSAERGPLDLELSDGRQLELTRNPVPDGSAVIIIEDVTERRESEAQMRHWARHDPLTGLPNRRDLCDRLERILLRAASDHEAQVAVMFLDLDDFKQVNDNLGHHAGDLVLKAVAERLRKMTRPGELVARLGGDELAIVVENTTAAACAGLAQRIIERLSEPYPLSGRTARVGASIGIAFATRGESFDLLMNRADAALYGAKKAGKGTCRFATMDAGKTVVTDANILVKTG
ncbi:PAS domain S-box-containing protein/diguanylate cyclase (GGDEF)-like protein [Paraburkholderia sp. BL23I1N1]|uniref:sensor domain-containing diguanylate cyclase n=1 Tax=Paraburkholderia sp. BL23I1N1 TaxID=1938802 RepID=UPI000E71B9B1|nr:sensor domain-containing diguanylate cyclase [Paraburkholderia sp. BL23I1N1]RKE23943.1 PAS domain S-box-containing protein/diguanylate cyclase (GGDEF)-like protein [Paraburkholderia sp. BL23I1N1]